MRTEGGIPRFIRQNQLYHSSTIRKLVLHSLELRRISLFSDVNSHSITNPSILVIYRNPALLTSFRIAFSQGRLVTNQSSTSVPSRRQDSTSVQVPQLAMSLQPIPPEAVPFAPPDTHRDPQLNVLRKNRRALAHAIPTRRSN